MLMLDLRLNLKDEASLEPTIHDRTHYALHSTSLGVSPPFTPARAVHQVTSVLPAKNPHRHQTAVTQPGSLSHMRVSLSHPARSLAQPPLLSHSVLWHVPSPTEHPAFTPVVFSSLSSQSRSTVFGMRVSMGRGDGVDERAIESRRVSPRDGVRGEPDGEPCGERRSRTSSIAACTPSSFIARSSPAELLGPAPPEC